MDENFQKRLQYPANTFSISPNRISRSINNLRVTQEPAKCEANDSISLKVRKRSTSPMSPPSVYRKNIGLRRSSPGSPLHRSPMASPVKERYGDRFIPSRTGNNWETNFNMITDKGIVGNKKATRDASDGSKDYSLLVYSSLLKNEILGTSIEDFKEAAAYANSPVIGSSNGNTGTDSNNIQGNAVVTTGGNNAERRGANGTTLPPGTFNSPGGVTNVPCGTSNSENRNLFSYRARRLNIINEATSPYSLTPVSSKSQKLLRSPRKASRKISKIPFKVLDAPELQDDFYLNLVDWSSQNVLSVGLGACVYLWSACTSQVTRLCDLTSDSDNVTSVSWSERGNLVAVGTHKGYVQVWDVAAAKRVNVLEGHTARVGALAWNGDSLSSGSRDRLILQRDIRTPAIQPERKLVGHRQEVCGLKWSPDNQWLASGGNDNKLFVWAAAGGSIGSNNIAAMNTNTVPSSSPPIHSFTDHLAAVKAIAWSPHHHGLLASGGGTADRCIRFWNTLTGQAMQSVDTGSQVCNLAWSKHASELVSTHGYSQNQILVWKYPSLVQVAKLTGHSYRVLYLAMSPDGEAIVTGAGDETLRFWNVFSKARSQKEAKSALNMFTSIR